MLKRAFRKRWLPYHTDGTLNYINQVEAAFWQTHFRGFGRNSWFCSITMLGPLSLLGQWSSQPSARSAERASKRRMMRKRMDSEDLESLFFEALGENVFLRFGSPGSEKRHVYGWVILQVLQPNSGNRIQYISGQRNSRNEVPWCWHVSFKEGFPSANCFILLPPVLDLGVFFKSISTFCY